MDTQITFSMFKLSDTIYILCLLQNFKTVCESSGIHERHAR